MPKAKGTKGTRKPKTALGRKLAKANQGTDKIKIGSELGNGEAVGVGDMCAVMAKVEGIRFLVKGWIPFGMLSMIMAAPGIGKSALALKPLSISAG